MPDKPDPNFDPDSATIPLSGPRPTLSGSNVDLPLPEELAKLLPAGAYEVTGFLGAGGMGAVYKGMQIRLKRPVAIKIMRRDMGKDHDFEARFEREAQAMAKLNHPNIISVIDFGEAGPDYLFIVMELVDGTDLMDVIRSKQMTQEMALALLPQICDALQFAHDHGIVHRDIKPSNIMLTRDGRVKMADFGLAKHFDVAESGFRTQTGTGMGTPDYAAPEQFDPTTQVDHRADIYALGVMIYQMITGALPRGVWRPPSQRAQVSTHWDAVVSRAMQNDPAERYQQASEVKTDVSGITPHQGRAVGPSAAATGPTSVKSPDTALGGPSALPKPKSRALLLAVVAAVVGGWGVFMAVSKKNTAHTIAVAPSSTEPAAIKLWNAPEMIRSLQKSNIRWENDAIHLVDKAGLPDGTVKQANVIVRAEVLMNATSTSPQIAGRVLRNETGPTDHYSLTLKPGLTAVKLTVQHGSLMTELGAWPLPRSYRQDEWLPLELRIVGDEITASAEGRVLGTVKDSSIQGAGGVMLYATEDGWFRNIEYVPLDEPAATAAVSASPPVAEPWVRVWNSPEGLSNAVTLVDGWVVSKTGGTTLGGTLLYPMQWHDSAIRSEWKWSGGPSNGSIGGHMSIREAGKHRYKLSRNKKAILLYRTDDNNATVLLQEYPVDEPKEGETFTLELRAVGTTLMARLDGKEVIRVEDDKLITGGPAVYVFEKGGMRNIEVLNLDQPAVVSSSPSLQAPKSPIAALALPASGWKPLFTDAEWKARPGFKNGLLNLSHDRATKPQTWSDGAIRARIEYLEGTKSPSLVARHTGGADGFYYRLGVGSDGKHIFLRHMDPKAEGILGRYFLPAPLKSGDKLLLELRVQGDRLVGLLDGKTSLRPKTPASKLLAIGVSSPTKAGSSPSKSNRFEPPHPLPIPSSPSLPP